jgi:Cytochrome c oxidase subunit III
MHNIDRQKLQAFPFHLVDPSPWPILISFSLLSMAIGAVLYFHGFNNGGYILLLGFILTTSGMTLWFKDVIYEGTYLKRKRIYISFNQFIKNKVQCYAKQKIYQYIEFYI